MARGWESKSIEDQQAQAWEKSSPSRPRMTPEQAARRRAKEGLLLSRQRVLHQLERVTDIRARTMLDQALAELNEHLAKLVD
jgi:hypothetical protein